MNEEQQMPPVEQVPEVKMGWKHHLTTVTPLSKALAMLLFFVLPFVGFWVGMRYGSSTQDTPIVPNIATEETAGDEVETAWRYSATAVVPEGWQTLEDAVMGFSIKFPAHYRTASPSGVDEAYVICETQSPKKPNPYPDPYVALTDCTDFEEILRITKGNELATQALVDSWGVEVFDKQKSEIHGREVWTMGYGHANGSGVLVIINNPDGTNITVTFRALGRDLPDLVDGGGLNDLGQHILGTLSTYNPGSPDVGEQDVGRGEIEEKPEQLLTQYEIFQMSQALKSVLRDEAKERMGGGGDLYDTGIPVGSISWRLSAARHINGVALTSTDLSGEKKTLWESTTKGDPWHATFDPTFSRALILTRDNDVRYAELVDLRTGSIGATHTFKPYDFGPQVEKQVGSAHWGLDGFVYLHVGRPVDCESGSYEWYLDPSSGLTMVRTDVNRTWYGTLLSGGWTIAPNGTHGIMTTDGSHPIPYGLGMCGTSNTQSAVVVYDAQQRATSTILDEESRDYEILGWSPDSSIALIDEYSVTGGRPNYCDNYRPREPKPVECISVDIERVYSGTLAYIAKDKSLCKFKTPEGALTWLEKGNVPCLPQ